MDNIDLFLLETSRLEAKGVMVGVICSPSFEMGLREICKPASASIFDGGVPVVVDQKMNHGCEVYFDRSEFRKAVSALDKR